MPKASPQEVDDAAEVALEIIKTVPVFLAMAVQEADDRKLTAVVQPVLDRAVRHFLHPIDILPEMTLGLAGLLDDTYLVLRTMQVLEEGPEPFVKWDFEHPTTFIRKLLGERISQQLDALSAIAFEASCGYAEAVVAQGTVRRLSTTP
jgi:uncharacterized membrane protein YkvA (DUF1232 family)